MQSDSLPANLGLLPRMAADRFHDRPAVIDAGSGSERHVSFVQFADGSDRVARALLTRGARCSERVVVVGHNHLEFVEAIFGVLRAGLVAVPVDERLGARTMEAIFKSCQPKAIITVGNDSTVPAMAASATIPIRITAGSPMAG